MSAALSPEARERLMGAVAACYNVNGEWLASHVLVADLRALLADSDALAAAERERDEARKALVECYVQLLTWFKTVDGGEWGGVAMRSTDIALVLAERALPDRSYRHAPEQSDPGEPSTTPEREIADGNAR